MAISLNGSLMMRLIMVGTSCIVSLCKIPGLNPSDFCSGRATVFLPTRCVSVKRFVLELVFSAQMKISSARMNSSAVCVMAFILRTHSI